MIPSVSLGKEHTAGIKLNCYHDAYLSLLEQYNINPVNPITHYMSIQHTILTDTQLQCMKSSTCLHRIICLLTINTNSTLKTCFTLDTHSSSYHNINDGQCYVN